MKIIGITDFFSGCFYHRIQLPLLLMNGPDCYITNQLSEKVIEEKGCDLLFLNRYAPYNKLEDILKWRNKYGFKLIVDVDDYWHLDPFHVLSDIWKKNNVTQNFEAYIKAADACTTTHNRLQQKVLELNEVCEIFPNAIPIGREQFKINKTHANKLRIFWQGSQTHRKDIELLRNPMKRIYGNKQLRDKIFMVFAGYKKPENGMTYPDWDEMLSAFTCGLKMPGMILEAEDVTNYYKFYEQCDAALVPLIDSTFNQYKSNLKILEAAACGASVVVSNVHPYKGFEGINGLYYVNNQRDWHRHIKHLADSDRKNDDLLFYYCREKWNFEKINEQRRQFFDNIICSKAA